MVKDTNQNACLLLLKDSLSDISLKPGMSNIETPYSVIEDKAAIRAGVLILAEILLVN